MAPSKKTKPKAKPKAEAKAKGNAMTSNSRRTAKDAAMSAKSAAGASSLVISEATMEDGKEAMELLNNPSSEVDGALEVVEVDGKTVDCSGDKRAVTGEVNCQGVSKEEKEDVVEKIAKKKIIRSRKRIKTSTIMASSAGKLALKSHDEPTSSSDKKLKGVNDDLKEHKNGEDDVPTIDNDKNNVACENIVTEKVGLDVENSGAEKVQVNSEKEVGESSKNKRKRLKPKNRKTSLIEGASGKVASERKGESGLYSEKNDALKAEIKGVIFMCTSKTKPDCYRYMVFGSPKRDIVEKIDKGMILFLYDIDKKLLYGTYKAAAKGGYDIEPKAFNSKYPAQVRFEIVEDCLPLAEKKFNKVIKDNYYTSTKFHCQLDSRQVENLCKLFRASSKDVKSERRRSRHVDRDLREVREQEREKAKRKAAHARSVVDRYKVRRPLARKGRHHERPHVRSRVSGERYKVRLPSAIIGHHHRERPLLHDEVYSLPRQPVRLPLDTDSSYAYERTLQRELYMGESSVPHHEIYRQQQLLEPRDTYRREVLLERPDTFSHDPYLEHRRSYRRERLLVPRDSYSVEQPPLLYRNSYRQYPIAERRIYDLELLAERRNYDLELLAERRNYDLELLADHGDSKLEPVERRDYYMRQSSLLDHQDFYKNDPVLEGQNRRQLILEPRHSIGREREDFLLSRQDQSAYSGGPYSTARPLRTIMASESPVYLSAAEAAPGYYSHRSVYHN